ncbi:unnamed protein product, partial [Symbiodinium sp. KB8]
MPATSAGNETSATYHFAVVEIVMLRHRRSDLVSANWPRILDAMAKDLDQWFGPIPEPAILLKRRCVLHDLMFEDEDFFVTRPVPADEPSARHFLMSTARRSLDEALGGGSSAVHNEKKSAAKEKKKKKEREPKKRDRSKKKKKKNSSSSSSQGEEESSSCLDSEDFDDSAALFGLARKEMAKPEEACRLDDFPSKQLGFVVSHVTEMLGATDVYECGGELEETLLGNREKRAQKLRQKEEKERSDDGKEAMQKKLTAILNKHREAATQDLKQQLSQQSSGSGKKPLPAPKPSKRKKPAEEEEPSRGRVVKPTVSKRSKFPAIRDKDPPQDEEHEEGEKCDESKTKGEGDGEFLGEADVPSPPGSEFEDVDDTANSDEVEAFLQESDEDNDVFAEGFAVEKKSKGGEDKAKGIPTKAKVIMDKLEQDLSNCIPKDLTEPSCCTYTVAAFVFGSDLGNWVRLLHCEGLLRVDDVKLVLSNLPGTVSASLGPGKVHYNKLSIKAKAELDPWAQRIARKPPPNLVYFSFSRFAFELLVLVVRSRSIQRRAESMAGAQWLGDRLRELSEWLGYAYTLVHGSDERNKLLDKLYQKFRFIDSSFLANKKLGDIDITPATWEEALDMHRAAFAKQKVYFRPRIFHDRSAKAPQQQQQMPIEDGESQNSSPPSSSKSYTATEILYLRSQGAVRGVLQLHKVAEPLQGYKVLLRAEEVWSLTKRRLQIAGGHVTLQSWKRFLDYSGINQRWHHCKMLSTEEQNIDTGIRLPVATWFIFRQPYQDTFEDQVTWGRLQRRLLHLLSQEAEREIMGGIAQQALSQMTFKSVGVLCDASPKAKMDAVMNILSHVGMELDAFFPGEPLTATVCGMEERRILELNSQNCAYILNKETGLVRWDTPMHSATQGIRLVLCADQGSPLHTCFQFLALSGASISLIRDELPPGGNTVFIVRTPLNRPAKPGDVLMQMFQRDILKENDLDETSDEQLNFSRVMVGKNPFKCENDSGKNYDKTVDICVKVLTSEEYFALFRIARNVLEPFREVTVKFRRAESLSSALREGHKMLLASIHEMLQYVLYLRSAPAKAAALLSTVEDEPTKNAVLKELEQEWRLVLALEDTPLGASLLRQHCSFCSFQQYREVMTMYEKNAWKMTAETAALTASWFPPTAWSASLESIFGDLQDAVKRSGRSDCGSLPNLFAVGVKLQADDWAGTQALGVKPKAFNPAS